jgi:ABC-type transporter Mla subunit MlaD
MNSKSHYIRIGAFVLTGVGLLIAGVLAFGARSYFAHKLTYETAIEGEVTGLSVGSTVLLRGVPIGRVSSIEFAAIVYPGSKSDMIVVDFDLDRPVFVTGMSEEARAHRLKEQIDKGLRAMVKLQGVTGASILSLEHLNPEDNPPPILDYTPRHPFVPSAPGQFTRILESIEQSLQNLQKLDFQSIGIGASNTLAETTRLMQKLNRIDLDQTVGKANSLLDNLNSAVGNITNTLMGMNLDAIGTNANSRLVELKDTNLKLQEAIDRIGTAPIGQTLDGLRSTLNTLNEVLLELKKYPSGFILGQPPLPARSVRPPSK